MAAARGEQGSPALGEHGGRCRLGTPAGTGGRASRGPARLSRRPDGLSRIAGPPAHGERGGEHRDKRGDDHGDEHGDEHRDHGRRGGGRSGSKSHAPDAKPESSPLGGFRVCPNEQGVCPNPG
ncbi:hypothetical protein E1262_05930 [Jiangella aurantiaca]|uniref:Uncharacterized protein n=1 Tax=Jiangella aurantiaca TaxID=2530373 RepID=A0A4R5AGV0_9ACTN|nr:hypothetical protein [Jiangella aurantiaca]TDD71671.1 hypothetical protein E1262_05930 [Jiangella aurantiaca]